ncbi:MAG: hypothetical protein JRG82_06880 [Deltaproteobacteria bacterium]|nr:hypothetical protein [Deltaproteobacteria bacterium]
MSRAAPSISRIALALTALFVCASPAAASVLLLGEIDQTTLGSITGAEIVTPLNTAFDYHPSAAPLPGDGTVFSTVFEGAGAAAGQFVYVYQIDHFATSSQVKSGGMNVAFGAVSNVAGIGEAFFVGNDSGVASPFMVFESPGQVDFMFYPFIYAGQLSHQFGLVSPTAPSTVSALVLDSGVVDAYATVYTSSAPPIPEPASQVLLLSGLMVVSLYGLRFASD